MRVVVFGAGAVGGLLGALLARAHHDVLLVAREGVVAALRPNGLTVEGPHGGTYPIAAVEALPDGPLPDALLVTVKAPDLAAAAGTIADRLPQPPPILLIQNGLGIEAAFREGWLGSGAAYPEASVVRAISTLPATRLDAGHIREAGSGTILLGAPPTGAAGSASLRLQELLASADIPVRIVVDLTREIWRKAILNAAINPVTADHGILNGALAGEPWRGQAEALLHEAQSVARAEGFDFPDAEIESDLWTLVRATASNRSSMRQDLERGRPTEIEFISGALLRIGAGHGIALPATERAAARIRLRRAPARPAPEKRPQPS
ncbi:MAG: ketopantoate reductase family protein [Thermoplasmata archaeon]